MGPELAQGVFELASFESEHENSRQQEELLLHIVVLLLKLETFRHLAKQVIQLFILEASIFGRENKEGQSLECKRFILKDVVFVDEESFHLVELKKLFFKNIAFALTNKVVCDRLPVSKHPFIQIEEVLVVEHTINFRLVGLLEHCALFVACHVRNELRQELSNSITVLLGLLLTFG